MAMRINQQAIVAAAEAAFEHGPSGRQWSSLSEEHKKVVTAQAEIVVRTYEESKAKLNAAKKSA